MAATVPTRWPIRRATVGQQRTRVRRRKSELCNALTGGFGVALMGFGSFCAVRRPTSEPSGLFPEVRPAYLDLMPECVDTRDTAPALALEAPFPTIKCRLVKQEDPRGPTLRFLVACKEFAARPY